MIMTNREIRNKLFSMLFKTFILIFLVSGIVIQLSDRIINPININRETSDKAKIIKEDLKMLVPDISDGYAREISESIKLTSEITNINDKILTSIAYHESRMRHNAVSSAGYKGIMQATRHDIYEFAIVDIIRGGKKLEEWIKYRKGNMKYALASYNGGTYPPKQSFDYADKVIFTAKKIETRREKYGRN